ncbi:MAG: OmpA family protein [Bacteroidetes bacterium]|nr:MAG: OmpA family protein [Bacteroidota bacterium]
MRKLFFALFILLNINLFSQEKEEELQPTLTHAKLNVIVTDHQDNPSSGGDIIILTSKNSGETYSGITNDNGRFSILIPKGQTYVVKYKGFGQDEEYTEIEIPNADALINFDFVIKYELPKVYTLENVYFDSGKSTLRPESYKALNNLAEVMLHKKSMKIEIAGHTDSDGDDEANMKLSQARAEAVKSYLIKKGIEAERIVAKGYGETQPVASNDTEEGKQKNRRTEVRILEQ